MNFSGSSSTRPGRRPRCHLSGMETDQAIRGANDDGARKRSACLHSSSRRQSTYMSFIVSLVIISLLKLFTGHAYIDASHTLTGSMFVARAAWLCRVFSRRCNVLYVNLIFL